MAIRNLVDHAVPYVTVRELAEYWRVSQKQIRRRMAAGYLSGVRLGPRICRISVASALAFERAAEQALEEGIRTDDRVMVRTPGSSRQRPH